MGPNQWRQYHHPLQRHQGIDPLCTICGVTTSASFFPSHTGAMTVSFIWVGDCYITVNCDYLLRLSCYQSSSQTSVNTSVTTVDISFHIQESLCRFPARHSFRLIVVWFLERCVIIEMSKNKANCTEMGTAVRDCQTVLCQCIRCLFTAAIQEKQNESVWVLIHA